MTPSPIGSTIATARKAKNLSARKLARLTGLSPTYVFMIEDGSSRPSEKSIQRLALALDLDVDVLLIQAGRFSDEMLAVFQQHPEKVATFLRDLRYAS